MLNLLSAVPSCIREQPDLIPSRALRLVGRDALRGRNYKGRRKVIEPRWAQVWETRGEAILGVGSRPCQGPVAASRSSMGDRDSCHGEPSPTGTGP